MEQAARELIGGDRPVRGCDVCGGVDDHPRHVIAGERGAAGKADPEIVRRTIANSAGYDDATRNAVLESILDDSSQDRHRDCCRAVGCPTGTCLDVANIVGSQLRGADLLAAHDDDVHAELLARHDARLED